MQTIKVGDLVTITGTALFEVIATECDMEGYEDHFELAIKTNIQAQAGYRFLAKESDLRLAIQDVSAAA